MFACDIWVVKKMEVRCFLLQVILFQTLVAWCGAKHVTIDFKTTGAEDAEIQDTIQNLIHTGIYSHQHLDPAAAQVTHPVKVTAEGALLSHVVRHAHAHGHARARRALHHTGAEAPHSLHYNLTVDGRDLRLDLRPSVTFITPSMVVERHRANSLSRSAPSLDATSCHYTGTIRGQPGSVVAISACDGLAGHLRTENGEYWIEPSNQQATDDSQPRPHVIFRRSAVDKVEAFHRAKRAVNNKNEKTNLQQNRKKKMLVDKRRREYLENRRKRLEAMRRNPVEYRRNQAKLRMEKRRSASNSRSNSISDESTRSLKQYIANKNRQRIIDAETERRMQKIRKDKNKNTRTKNCATKQPPYQWRKQNAEEERKQNYAARQKNNLQKKLDGMRRSTRSVSKPRHVEVLLVADKSMTDFHAQGELETYLLTIMNMVSSLYMDPTIGNYIKIVVVKISLLEEIDSARELHISTNADDTLASFCRWQQGHNPGDDENPHHHDVAILVTRKDICSQHNSPCSTLGVAHVAGMCNPDRSCSVNEDNGIMLAHTITHELGHNFGLYHDTEEIGCHRRDGDTLHIMTPIFEADTVQMAWSRCSKRDVTNFLDAGLGECLSDRPSHEEYYVYPDDPAGVLYDANSQCRLMFGVEDATVCSKPTEICERLWCFITDNSSSCQTMFRPAAPGTACGHNKWCQNQTCVEKSPSPSPVDGGWSEWSEWSPCSRSCGAGVSTQSRECNNPAPNNNGAYCIGARSRPRVCNTNPCPINEPSFREVQCAKHNNMSYKNDTITEWIPYFDQDKPCELQCIGKDKDVEMLNGFVADGTPCKQTLGSRDMCIAGVCYKVGCDWVVGSEAKEDACGVCGGDGSACKTVLGSYSKDTTKQTGLDEVATIPAGSRNVKIQEKVSPGNFISIGSAKTRKLYLTGSRNKTTTAYLVGGSQAIYERDRDWEKVMIPGPLTEDIKVYQQLYRGRKHRNPGVIYQYTVDAKRLKRYHYRQSEWSACNATCGEGIRTRQMECVDGNNRVVEPSDCYNIEFPRQIALMQRCQNQPCPTPEPNPRPNPQNKPNHTQSKPLPFQTRLTPQSRALPFQTQITPQSRQYNDTRSLNKEAQSHSTVAPYHTPTTRVTESPYHQPMAANHKPIASNHQTEAPYRQPIASKHQTVAPYHQQVASNHQPIAPHHQPVASNHPTVAPHHPPIAPNHQTVAPHHPPIAPNHQTVAPHHPPIAPNHQTVALHHPPIAPNHQTVAPHHPPIAPNHQTVAPYHVAPAPNQHKAVPGHQTEAPTHYTAPKLQTIAPTYQARAPPPPQRRPPPQTQRPTPQSRLLTSQSRYPTNQINTSQSRLNSQPRRPAPRRTAPQSRLPSQSSPQLRPTAQSRLATARSRPSTQSRPTANQSRLAASRLAQHRLPNQQTRALTPQRTPARSTVAAKPQPKPKRAKPQAHWKASPWQQCSQRCYKPGQIATKRRTVYCVIKKTKQVVADSRCDIYSKPFTIIKCANIPPC